MAVACCCLPRCTALRSQPASQPASTVSTPFSPACPFTAPLPPSGDSRRAELQWQGPAERPWWAGTRLCSRADRSVQPAAGGSLWRAHSPADAGLCCPRAWRAVCRCAHKPGRRVAGWVGQGWVEMGKCVKALRCISGTSIGAGLRHPQLGTCQPCRTGLTSTAAQMSCPSWRPWRQSWASSQIQRLECHCA